MPLLKEPPMKHFNGNIFQIQRWSIHDGEGIRSTVFLKGCPLRCKWCANPESWNSNPEVLFFRERCNGCGRCSQVCDANAATMTDQGIAGLNREMCRTCGKCCAVCPNGARKQIGSTVTVEDVLKIIKRDTIFYRESGGGVTFSGGEPFNQPEFLRQLVAACSRLGIDAAVETCGYFDWEQVKDIFELLECVFVDIKQMDDQIHRKFTGVSNHRILENIIRISEMHPKTIVRIPLIEEINAGETNIRQTCEFLREHTRVAGIELLPYHDFGQVKCRALGAVGETYTTPDASRIEEVKRIIKDYRIPILDFK